MEDCTKLDNFPDPETKMSIASIGGDGGSEDPKDLDDLKGQPISTINDFERLDSSGTDEAKTTLLGTDSEVETELQIKNHEIETELVKTLSNINSVTSNKEQTKVAQKPLGTEDNHEAGNEIKTEAESEEEKDTKGTENLLEESKEELREESKEEAKEESKEESKEGTKEDVASSKPKRLTLQERLKLAAQTKAKRKTEQKGVTSSAIGISLNGTAESSSTDLTDAEALKISAPFPTYAPSSTPVMGITPSSTPSSVVNNRDSVISNLQKKLEAKEIQVKELLEEGMKLSANEVSLLQTVKRLKQENATLVNQLNKVSEINETLEVKSHRLEVLEKEFAKEEALASKYDQLKTEFQQREKELKKLQVREANLENKLQDANQSIRELDEKNIHLQSNRDQAVCELRECELSLNSTKVEAEVTIKKLKEEVLGLEERIEILRVANENSQQSEKSDNLENYEQLRRDFSQSRENWKLIEDSYIHKISVLESDISSSITKEQQSGKQVKALSTEIKELARDNTKLINDVQTLSKDISALKKEIQLKNDKIQKLNETLENKENTFDLEKKRLLRKLEEKSFQLPEPVSLPDPLFRERSLGDISSTSITSSLKPINNNSHNSFQLGESSSRRVSTASIFDNSVTNDNDARTIDDSSFPHHATDVLTSQLRSLELQISKLKTENRYLAEEKKGLSQEVVKLMKMNENSKTYEHEIASLSQQLQESKTEYENVLILLGEKSELVEELKADVEDLKEICQQQVKDMVKLTSKMKA